MVPPIPPGRKITTWGDYPVDNFLIFISQQILLNIKVVEFDFKMGCILLSVFMNNKRAIYKLRIFEFSIFLPSKLVILAYFDSKQQFLSLNFL